jgi:hypothetical protein
MDSAILNYLCLWEVLYCALVQEGERDFSWGNPENEFPPLFADSGWRIAKGASIVFRPAECGTDVQAKFAIATESIRQHYQKRIDTLRENAASVAWKSAENEKHVLSNGEYALALQECLDRAMKNGFAITNTGQRRTYAAVKSALVWGLVNGKDWHDFTIPCVIRAYPTLEALDHERYSENDRRGQHNYVQRDKLAIVAKWATLGYSVADIVRKTGFPGGLVGPYRMVSQIDSRVPGIVKQLCTLPDKPEKGQKPAYVFGKCLPVERILTLKADLPHLSGYNPDAAGSKPEAPEERVLACYAKHNATYTKGKQAPKPVIEEWLRTVLLGDIHVVRGLGASHFAGLLNNFEVGSAAYRLCDAVGREDAPALKALLESFNALTATPATPAPAPATPAPKKPKHGKH